MFIVYDQTWKRHLVYGRLAGDKSGPKVLLSPGSDEPVSVFRTRKSAEQAIENTRKQGAYAWSSNIYVLLSVRLERKK
jgi:hypothetical protein